MSQVQGHQIPTNKSQASYSQQPIKRNGVLPMKLKLHPEKDHISRGWLVQNDYQIIREGSDENGAFLVVRRN